MSKKAVGAASASFSTVLYHVQRRVAYITLHRPAVLNAIDMVMPQEIEEVVRLANDDNDVHAIVLCGSGKGFCGGYDLAAFAQTPGENPGVQSMPWDPMVDFRMMYQNTEHFMSLWRSPKPTVAQVHGAAVAGGSDIALCCDFVIMASDARIGYPPARVWGCPTTAMWVYRLGIEQAKRMLLTGDVIDGAEAKRIGLVLDAVPETQLEQRVDALVQRIASVPKNQLMMHKMLINQAHEQSSLRSTQVLANLFDGMARHSPEGMWFKQHSETVGFKRAVAERDSGLDCIAPGISKPFLPFERKGR